MKQMSKRIEQALLEKNGGNQSEMARFVGVTPQAVQKWIAGESEPRGKNLTLAAQFLGMSESALRYGDASGGKPTLQLQQVRPTIDDQRPSAQDVIDMANAFFNISSAKVRNMLLKSAVAAAKEDVTVKANSGSGRNKR